LNYTVNAITNASGAIVEGYKVQPYGSYSVVLPGADGKLGTADDIAQASSSIGNDRVWQGLQYDNGVYLVRYRVAHAGLGVWLSKDPAKADLNDYRVMGGMPMSATDAWGLDFSSVTTGRGTFNLTVNPMSTSDGKAGAQLGIGFDDSKIPKCDRCDEVSYKQEVVYTKIIRLCKELGNSYWDPCSKNPTWYYPNGKSDIKGGFSDFAGIPGWDEKEEQIWLARTYAWCRRKGAWSLIASFEWWYALIPGEAPHGGLGWGFPGSNGGQP
jgi:RHS repeat-associated protein